MPQNLSLGPATGWSGGVMDMSPAYWLPALFLALSSNLDNVGVGVAYGIRKVCIPFASNLVIAVITSTGTLAAMLAGQAIGRFLQPHMARLVGGSLLIGLGGWAVFQGSRPVAQRHIAERAETDREIREASLLSRVSMILDNPFSADQDFSRHIDQREALLLGIALSMNNLVNGVAAGIAGLEPALVTILVFVFSIVTVWVGMSVGHRFGALVPSRYTGMVSGMLLISIGVYETFF
jgi:putative sporulation protein YtaF